jgi:polyferredoxin
VRLRTVLYGAMLAVVAAVMLTAFVMRTDTELTVQRDRSPNFVRLSNGDIRNSYAVKILNKSREQRHFQLVARGVDGAMLSVAGDDREFAVHADAVGTFRVFLTVPASQAPSGSASVTFAVNDATGRERASHGAVFVGPIR